MIRGRKSNNAKRAFKHNRQFSKEKTANNQLGTVYPLFCGTKTTVKPQRITVKTSQNRT